LSKNQWCKGRHEGATSVEYAIMLMLVALVVVFSVALMGESIGQVFCDVAPTLGSNC
jgi:Flp pilus assembly pilin Flp